MLVRRVGPVSYVIVKDGLTILVDCPLDLSSQGIARVGTGGTFLFDVSYLDAVDLAAVDVILCSNHSMLMALPYITEYSAFRGTILTTEPSVTFGRLFMEELILFAHPPQTAQSSTVRMPLTSSAVSSPFSFPSSSAASTTTTSPADPLLAPITNSSPSLPTPAVVSATTASTPTPSVLGHKRRRSDEVARVDSKQGAPVPAETMTTRARTLRALYSMTDVTNSLSKVKVVAFGEKTLLSGKDVHVTATSSGYCIGGCNWTVHSTAEIYSLPFLAAKTDSSSPAATKSGPDPGPSLPSSSSDSASPRDPHHLVSIVTASSFSAKRHPAPVDLPHLAHAQVLVFTQAPRVPAAGGLQRLTQVLYDTLVKKKGAVLLPTFSSGVLYDLLDYVDNLLKSQGLNVPVLLISPIAKACLDVSGISSEWLFDARQGKAFQATHPFGHYDMLKSQRLQVYASVHDQAFVEAFGAFVHVSRYEGARIAAASSASSSSSASIASSLASSPTAAKTDECPGGDPSANANPCIVFCGHPSLSCGDITYFLNAWGHSARNSMILTEPDFLASSPSAPALLSPQSASSSSSLSSPSSSSASFAMESFDCPLELRLSAKQIERVIQEAPPARGIVISTVGAAAGAGAEGGGVVAAQKVPAGVTVHGLDTGGVVDIPVPSASATFYLELHGTATVLDETKCTMLVAPNGATMQMTHMRALLTRCGGDGAGASASDNKRCPVLSSSLSAHSQGNAMHMAVPQYQHTTSSRIDGGAGGDGCDRMDVDNATATATATATDDGVDACGYPWALTASSGDGGGGEDGTASVLWGSPTLQQVTAALQAKGVLVVSSTAVKKDEDSTLMHTDKDRQDMMGAEGMSQAPGEGKREAAIRHPHHCSDVGTDSICIVAMVPTVAPGAIQRHTPPTTTSQSTTTGITPSFTSSVGRAEEVHIHMSAVAPSLRTVIETNDRVARAVVADALRGLLQQIGRPRPLASGWL